MTARHAYPSLVFWQNQPSLHQGALISAAVTEYTGRVVVVTDTDISPGRLAMGWQRPSYGGADVHVAPSLTERLHIESGLPPDTIHILSGVGVYPGTSGTMARLIERRHQRLFAYLEGWDPRGVAGQVRRLRHFARLRRSRKSVAGYLVTGRVSVAQYASVGVPRDLLHEFGYFVGQQPGGFPRRRPFPESLAAARDAGTIRFVFVGSLEKWKRLEWALNALARNCDKPWTLEIVGLGSELARLRKQADVLKISDRLDWLGAVPNAVARQALRTSDVLLLPSAYDGWGAVVNEALMDGTRVIVSRGAGAADLVRQPRDGWVFAGNDSDQLCRAVNSEIQRGPVPMSERALRREWAEAHISPRVAVSYLLALTGAAPDHSAVPLPPWRTQ